MLQTTLRTASLLFFVIGILFFGVTTNVRAHIKTDQDGEHMDAKRKAFQERATELRTNAAARKEALTERIEERRTRISENVETRVRTVMTNMQLRINRAIAKLGSIADRIESRAHKMEEQGINADTSLALVSEARLELRAASVSINTDMAAEIDAAVTAEEPKATFEQVKESVREVHEHLKAAQKALRDAVAALKVAASAGTSIQATTTDQ